ncbi:MAG: arsenate reductase (glutaredoxin) [Gammaproteobacteria bacterium]|nr:arsenate reductase (glutaredoxin) [Gammaproteobacteria bacterium]NIM72860.1 arsenate reductase (glutaredoxin) [Gammaproteobacteria bacterium]NIN38318.1 arsenate reductase (glutaredoxin) [Gammaproteobacteria bacterium]NIO24608.1 arsenate reductase (glutaredoxin) [Gammaproteobacteria bacterium]NIO65217.1 arsenate reductase (glutaredoxin) [Gammaproteobacteria bacterium]
MDHVTLYHNPRCSKSRKALELLRAHNVEPEIVEYLKAPPSLSELDRILTLLGMEPRELMRRKETVYKDLALDDESLDRHSLLQAMVEHPILIERPIAVSNDRAALGRPPDNVLDVL